MIRGSDIIRILCDEFNDGYEFSEETLFNEFSEEVLDLGYVLNAIEDRFNIRIDIDSANFSLKSSFKELAEEITAHHVML